MDPPAKNTSPPGAEPLLVAIMHAITTRMMARSVLAGSANREWHHFGPRRTPLS